MHILLEPMHINITLKGLIKRYLIVYKPCIYKNYASICKKNYYLESVM